MGRHSMHGSACFGIAVAFGMLAACSAPGRGPVDSREPVNVSQTDYADVDNLVAFLIRDADTRPYPVKIIQRSGEPVAERRLTIGNLELRALTPSETNQADLWVAAVTAWPRGGIQDSCQACSLRLYRRDGGNVRMVGTTDDSPLVRSARSKAGLAGMGELLKSLVSSISAIERFEANWSPVDPKGWIVKTCYIWQASCSASGGATVWWLIRDDRFMPLQADYESEPLVIQSESCRHNGAAVIIGKRAHFQPSATEVAIERTDSLRPWLEFVDTLLAVSRKMLPLERVAGMATPTQLDELGRYGVWALDFDEEKRYVEVCPYRGEQEQSGRTTVCIHASQKRGVHDPVIGSLRLTMSGGADMPRLESLSFIPDAVQPDWEQFK
jgi:hypothetical protein